MHDPVVRLTGVCKEYSGTHALAGVDLRVEVGEAVAVMGPSGSGKSTLLNIVAGLDRPTSGSVVVAGRELTGLSETGLARFRRTGVGIVFQFFNLLDDLPVLDNVALAGRLGGLHRRQAYARALELLDQLGVADRRDLYPSVLSGGERQRVGVARALVNRPALLLADEPTGAVDSRAGDQIAALLLEVHKLGQTLLLVTHDRQLADRCADRTVTFADGRAW